MTRSARPFPPHPASGPDRPRRILFLDDDPQRATLFLEAHPEAVWVQTVAECLARLVEPWDEVHLDHDLGGETYVDLGRVDCGMEIVRWLCLEPRPHLKRTQFYIHSHNINAACMMIMQMHVAGFQVEGRPFGLPTPLPVSDPEEDEHTPQPQPRPRRRFGWLRSLLDSLAGRSCRPRIDPR